MDSRQLTEVAEHVRGSGLGEQLRDYHRTSVLIVTAGQDEVLRLRIGTGDGELRIDRDASSTPDTPDDTLIVRIGADAALAVGSGTSLLEDEFAAGAISLEGAQPDDYRQAPVLEQILEGLARAGALAGTEATS